MSHSSVVRLHRYSRRALHDQICQLFQPRGPVLEDVQGKMCRQAFFLGHFAGALDTVDRREGDLFLLGILACGFAECRRGLFDVQHVVDNLKRQACVLAEFAERGELLTAGTCLDTGHANAGAQQCPGFSPVNGFE